MSSSYPRLPLAEVLDFREGPGILAKDFVSEGTPLIRLSGTKVGSDLLEGCNYLDPDVVDRRWSQFRLAEGDVLLSTSASLGEVAVVKSSGVGAVPYTGLIRFRPAGSGIAAEFIEYALRSSDFKAQIEAMGVGSVMKHFGPSHLRQMYITVPPVADQRAIAEVLGALDDKIAAGDEVVRRCDELASTYFRAMLRGKDGQTVPLSDLARFVNGGAYTKGASGSGKVVVRIAELNSGIGGSTVYSDREVEIDQTVLPGDLLFAWSGSLTVHRWFRDPAIVNQHIFKVIPDRGSPMWLVNQALRAKLDDFKATAADKATTMGHIQRRHLDELVRIPGPSDIAAFDAAMSGLWSRALAAEQESLRLAATRDALLPALMSGRLTIRDAERLVSDVT
ncbi:restriction endonuclease subunit S [Serinibacter arcticus]|nr:restriction endonuclease subunit S [Serinibacter arcticus]